MLIVTIVMLVNYTPVQNYLAKKATNYLSEKLKTPVKVAHLRLDFLNHVLVQGVYIEDRAHDTLLYAGEIQVRITDWFFFKDKPVIHYIGLHDTYAHLYRTAHSNEWNYQYIIDAFGSSSNNSGNKPIEFDLRKVELEKVRFHMDDKWGGEDLDFDIGSLLVNANDMDYKKKIMDLGSIAIHNADVQVNEYKPGHPPRPQGVIIKPVIDTTPFNTSGWKVVAKTLTLDDCIFRLLGDDKVPAPDLFDENHLVITKIKARTNDIIIVGDTIHGNLTDMFAHERCGIEIRKMRSKITVSPIATICDELYLETNNSKLRHYYSMNYTRFPCFLDYIDSVVMVAHLSDATVDIQDIAYFAPQLKKFPNIMFKAKGDGKGTVAKLEGHNLLVSDGNSVLKGNLTMVGLPDIYKTFITFSNSELATNGAGILRYVPNLKNSPDISLESINYAVFNGSFTGYVENFSVKGLLRTNLGSLATDMKLNLPEFSSKSAIYSGTVATDKLQLGILLRQPLLGGISLKESITGKSFDPDNVQANINGIISELTLNGYTYHNITTNGLLAKKQFNGKVLVDDPNLALEFDGNINYANKNIDITAQAHLLACNFQALHLTKDTITASADFDLDCTGSNIDNFSGYAKLNNIDLKRNSHKLAIDSVLVRSTGDTLNKLLTIQSNDVLATIKGNYRLSKLSSSVQFYLSRYLPNYISAPANTAPDQDFAFKVNTYNIDSLLAVAYPLIRGFDNSEFIGSLNTTAKKLTLSTTVPYGSIGNVHMSNIAITGSGNLESLGINTNIDYVSIGDSLVNGSLSVTATVANDTVAYTIATTTPDTSTSITLNGRILARKDSLYFTMLPSQFYLSQAKWDIAGGSKITYTTNYLQVAGLNLSSGLQKINVASQMQVAGQPIIITSENLDIGQLGSWIGLSAYQPDGRLNGTITISNLFNGFLIRSNIKATDVLLGTDTVGTVNIIGSYSGPKKLISFDPQTGIYRDNSSITASGDISFDSLTQQKLDGRIQFKNAPVSWSSPFLAGILSHLTGTVDGSVKFEGTSYEPRIDGDLTVKNAGVKVDYMGCSYTLPYAAVHVNNTSITFGKLTIYDSYKNTATITGHFYHRLFNRMGMHINIASQKMEVMNLTSAENNLFYGNLIASMDSFVIKGRFNNLKLYAYNAAPAARSRFYIPVTSSAGGDAGSYSFASFKVYGKNQDKLTRQVRDKIDISIDANLNNLAEMHIVLDPSSGDEIMARGKGRLQIDVPPANDIAIHGQYFIDNGLYTFTFKSLFIERKFKLNSGSTISFNGPFNSTTLDVYATYAAKARLYDILSDADKTFVVGNEKTDAQEPQFIDVNLHMNGFLNNPKLTFDLDLEDKHSQSTLAYQRLKIINNDDRQKLNQVASLLLINSFIPPDGIGGNTAITGAVNNISQILSSTTSMALTNIVNKLLKDKDLNVDVKYTNYNYNDQQTNGITSINRNAITAKVNKSYLNERLLVEIGSTSDWGRPSNTSSTNTNFNLTGDFRIQYQLSQESNLRLNVFRTSDYDVTLDRDIVRSGVGINWHKSFDKLGDFFRGNKYFQQQKQHEMDNFKEPVFDSVAKKPLDVKK